MRTPSAQEQARIAMRALVWAQITQCHGTHRDQYSVSERQACARCTSWVSVMLGYEAWLAQGEREGP